MGLEIPTSASGILETAAKLYHYKELERIRFHLAVLNEHAAAHRKVAEKLGILKKLRDFDKAFKDFERSQMALLNALAARQEAYVTFGQQLDETAAKSTSVPGEAPGRGKERFTTVMAVTALAREVLVMAAGAEEGLGTGGGARGPRTSSRSSSTSSGTSTAGHRTARTTPRHSRSRSSSCASSTRGWRPLRGDAR